jgi:hypothetical protein
VRRYLLVESHQAFGVIGPNRPQVVRLVAVANHVAFEVRWVVRGHNGRIIVRLTDAALTS